MVDYTDDYRQENIPLIQWIDCESGEDIHITDSFDDFFEEHKVKICIQIKNFIMGAILSKIGCLLFVNIAIASMSIAQSQKNYQLIIVDNVISVKDSDERCAEDSINWISLPHCSKVYFKKQFDEHPKIKDGVSISENWKGLFGAKFDSCSIILMIRYSGDMNFSGGGDDINCYLLTDNDKVDIMKAGKKDEILFSVITRNSEITFGINDWIINFSGKKDSFLKSYSLYGENNIKTITEKFTLIRFKRVYENNTKISCM